MTIAITGGFGFLGWHTACRIRATRGVEPLRLGREDFVSVDRLTERLVGVETLIHIAGVNRVETPHDVEGQNLALGAKLAEALRAQQRPIDVAYANSIQADQDNAYGRGKRAAADVLGDALASTGGRFADIRLPNLFGEHGRPAYNSFVATFLREVLAGRVPTVTGDREIELLHVQGAAESLIQALGTSGVVRPSGHPRMISDVLGSLQEIHALYGDRGEIPAITDPFSRDLFNTYRSAHFPGGWPIHPQVHRDERGSLFESVRSHGGPGQSFASTTRPGKTRGDHYHLHKVERFSVVSGEAVISLRRLLHEPVIEFRVSGEKPSFIDMPTMWVHKIRNVGGNELVTMFWADQLLDPENPDQYPEKVEVP